MSPSRRFRSLKAIAGLSLVLAACGPVEPVEKILTLKDLQDNCRYARDLAVRTHKKYFYEREKLSNLIGNEVTSNIATNSTEFDKWREAEKNYEFWCQKVTPDTKVLEDKDGYITIKYLAPGSPLEADVEIGTHIVDADGNQYIIKKRFGSLYDVSDSQSTKMIYRYEFTLVNSASASSKK